MWCGQAPLCPGQCVVPAIEDPRAELAKGWAAAASRLGGERLCFNWEAGLCERFCRSAACQQRIQGIGNCHFSSPSAPAVSGNVTFLKRISAPDIMPKIQEGSIILGAYQG